MAQSQARGVYAGQTVPELQATHRELRHELTSIIHWRRLLKARMDLCTAHAAPPKQLGGSITEYFSSSDLPVPHEITELPKNILGDLHAFRASTLPELKAQDSALRQYERVVRSKYMELSSELAQRHAR
jgi:hypothetical protein